MFEKLKTTMASRDFQMIAGQVVIAATSILVANATSKLVSAGMMKGLTALMDKVHGKIEEPSAE